MTCAALTKLLVVLLVAFILCLPEFFSSGRGGYQTGGYVAHAQLHLGSDILGMFQTGFLKGEI